MRNSSAQSGTREALRQFLTGNDFEPPERLLADLPPDLAATVPTGLPYSIAQQVAHMVYWQKLWLGRIREQPQERTGEKRDDWPAVAPEGWEEVRREFLSGLEDAEALAHDDAALSKRLANGDTVDAVLLMLILHNTYHLGEIALLRQILRSWPPRGSNESW